MASITTWMRLEPHSRSQDMEAGLEMRIHDPLWMLARQWQFGEFLGEDAGSPVWAAFDGEEMPISLYLPGPVKDHTRQDIVEYSPDIPLEYLVERERTPALQVMTANARLAVEAGQHFLRLLGKDLTDNYRAGLMDSYGLKPVTDPIQRKKIDADSLSFLDWMANHALDGSRILEAVEGSTTTDYAAALGFNQNDAPAANRAVAAWVSWCENIIGTVRTAAKPAPTPRAAWNPERMEYTCALAAPVGSTGKQIILKAEEYHGGHLDWYSFDALTGEKLNRETPTPGTTFDSEGNLAQRQAGDSEADRTSTIPTVLSFRGMPSNRLWEFEDGQVRFGSIQAGATDLARMLLVEFCIAYGNDFFTIPIEVKSGSLFHIANLTITNTFGDVTKSSPFAEVDWRMFNLSTTLASNADLLSSVLFLPPVLDNSLESTPIEEVHLLRDEMANIAWAVERIVESKSGKPLDRHEAYQASRQREQEDQPPAGQGTLAYHLDTWQSTLPDYWLPLLPEQITPGQSPMRLACVDQQGNIQGSLLSEHTSGTQLYVLDQEVPRMGAQIKRTRQYARWYDGRIFSWIGREKRPGRGEGSSGLRNDTVDVIQIP